MSDEELELRCVNALAGAAEVRNRILGAIPLGTSPTLEKLSYMVKCRVKSPKSLLNKVQEKRKDPDRSNYQPSDVRDIIGLRFLALYRKELPELVARFLEFVVAGQSDYLSLFAGTELLDCVEEVIIYSTSHPKENDPVDNQLIEVFAGRGIFLSSTGEDSDAPKLRLEYKNTKYSSIHIVLWCRNELGVRDGRRVPLEVQIRTAFEDVWGEIDHSMNYKVEGIANTLEARNHLEIAKQSLKNLKEFLNACSQAADVISKQMSFARPVEKSSSFPVSSFSIYPERIKNLAVTKGHADLLAEIVREVKDAFRQVGSGNYSLQDRGAQAISETFEICGERLFSLGREFEDDTEVDDSKSEERVYYAYMESALCFYWAGRILTAAQEPEKHVVKVRQFTERSLEIYSILARSQSFSKDAILDFRMATTFSALGKDIQAREKFKDAVANLEFPQRSLGEKHFLRARIPRHLGVAYWEQAVALREEAERCGYPDMFAERCRELYLEALRITVPLSNKEYDALDPEMQFDPEDAADEQLKTKNNILEYAVCFVRSGGRLDSLSRVGVDLALLRQIMSDLEGDDGIEGVQIPVWADTLRAAYTYLAPDQARAKACARRLRNLISENRDRWVARNGEKFVREMEDDANTTLGAEFV